MGHSPDRSRTYSLDEIRRADKQNDGYFSLKIYRRISRFWAYIFVNIFHITNPNYITLAGLCIGFLFIIVSLLPIQTNTKILLIGILYFLYFTIDCTDGIVARLTGNTTELGKKLDAFVDGRVEDMLFLSLYLITRNTVLIPLWIARKMDKIISERLRISTYKILGDKIFKQFDNRTNFHFHAPDLENITFFLASITSWLYNNQDILINVVTLYVALSFIGDVLLLVLAPRKVSN